MAAQEDVSGPAGVGDTLVLTTSTLNVDMVIKKLLADKTDPSKQVGLRLQTSQLGFETTGC